jgi:hypothetical protein
MIRRFYILPLLPGAAPERVEELIAVLRAADRFIPGLRDSSAGLDLDSRTVLWENTFVDEASYAGPYMVHPFHIGAIDDFVMADSPTNLTQDIFTSRYQTPDATQHLRAGIRRVLLLNLSSDADAAALAEIAALASSTGAMASSAFGADDVGWVSAKGRAYTHVWEQGFTDRAALQRYLGTRDGIACSSREGFTRLGIHVNTLRILTCPFELTPTDEQVPADAPADDTPVRYSLTMRVGPDDADALVAQLEERYDPFMTAAGAPLVHRSRTVGHGYLDAEVQSTWRLDSLAAYAVIRAQTYADPGWNAFVRDAMPLVRGGTRRFHRATTGA